MAFPGVKRMLHDPRFMFIAIFGFASGLPYMLTGRTLKLWAASQGIDLSTIGLLSLVTLPYTFKFVWAPLMDRFTLPYGDRRLGWLAVWQTLLVLSLLGMAWLGPSQSQGIAPAFFIACFATAFFSASVDVVEAGYRTDILNNDELPVGASLSVMGYRVAMLVTGTGALLLASHIDW
jgi:PAT family beta-lactamase induction signal transducer AmpG